MSIGFEKAYALQTDLNLSTSEIIATYVYKKGLLDGRKAICFPGFEGDLTGAEISAESVVQDGRFITAKGAGVALEFALKLSALLTSDENAKALSASLQCR